MSEASEQNRVRKWFKRWKKQFRLVIVDPESFHEKWSTSASAFNTLWLALAFAIVIISLTFFTIAFTPLRSSIPGTNVGVDKKLLSSILMKVDSVEKLVKTNDIYLENFQIILSGRDSSEVILLRSKKRELDLKKNQLPVSKEDSILRAKIQMEASNAMNIDYQGDGDMNGVFFFKPVEGKVSQSYDAEKKHYGLDVIAPKNEHIKAAMEGTVIFAGWTSEDGHVIILQHERELITIYKHNSTLLKNIGDHVSPGDPIAVIGNSGERTDSPHLHFELWQNGKSLNPEEFLAY